MQMRPGCVGNSMLNSASAWAYDSCAETMLPTGYTLTYVSWETP